MTTSRLYIDGKTPKSVARRATRWAHKQRFPKGTKKLDGWQMNAVQRYHDLDRLASYRKRNGPDLGEPLAWAQVVANLCRVRDGQVTITAVNDTVRRLGLPPLTPTIVSIAVREIAGKAWGRYALYTPDEAGVLLKVTMVERAAADLVKLDAIDEPSADRKRRLDRERKRRTRAARAAQKPPKKSEMARSLGVSRPTVYAWIKSGKLDPQTGEIVDLPLIVRMSTTEGSNHRTEFEKPSEATV